MYYYNRPIGTYTFIAVFALSMIVTLSSDGEFTLMGFAISIFWGMVAYGGGNILWALVGDVIAPYIENNRDITEDGKDSIAQRLKLPQQESSTTIMPDTPLQTPGNNLERQINKVINDGKLWAKGMTILTSEEEEQLRLYFKRRWESPIDDVELPSFLINSLRDKLQERGLASSGELTERGKRTIPWGKAMVDR